MAKLYEYDFYYGAALSHLFNKKIDPALVEDGADRQVYDFTTDKGNFRLFLKYRSEPTTKTESYNSWQFGFSKSEIKELNDYIKLDKQIVIGLICGQEPKNESQFAILHKEYVEELMEKVFEKGKTRFTIGRQKRGRYFRVPMGGGRANDMQIRANIDF